jgi:hypothetical protein
MLAILHMPDHFFTTYSNVGFPALHSLLNFFFDREYHRLGIYSRPCLTEIKTSNDVCSTVLDRSLQHKNLKINVLEDILKNTK